MTVKAYYNEFNPYAAQWLRSLITKGLIADGEVDTRSIVDVRSADLREFGQCHFFAGLGGWSYAARLAGWPDDWPIWTGSCPCQPWSVSGEREAFEDDRHLWPNFFRLIQECSPDLVVGEQVSGESAYAWLDEVATDFEGIDYAFGAIDTDARIVGAFHKRPRIYWVGYANGEGLQGFEHNGGGVCFSKGETSAIGVNRELFEGLFGEPRPESILHFDGLSRPVGIIGAFGNAIVPALGAEFISAVADIIAK